VRPPVALLMMLGVMMLRPLGLLPARLVAGLRGKNKATGLENAQEIRDLVESAQASGVLEESGKELIESIFTFSDTRVHEVMVPRPDILALPVESEAGQVLDTLQESGFSRIPLHEGNIDRIAGILHAQDVLGALSREEWNFTARDLLRPALYLPESKKLDEALASMRAARTHLAIVIDEYGGTAGLLTFEDILEELVGEIADEHDRKAEDPLQIVNEDTALVDALLHTDDLEEQWNLPLPTGEFDTVGGFMIEQLGRALVVGDRVELPNALLVVQTVRGRRPKKILITRKIVRERDE
jgi:putative hemolysin